MKPFSWRFPWITAALAALFAAAWLRPSDALEFDRARVASGGVWRLITGQLVHWTPRMAALDIGMVLGLGIWLELRGERWLLITSLALGGGLTALAVQTLSPDLMGYRGSSGVASTLFILTAVRIADPLDPRSRSLSIAAIALFLSKAAFESFAGQTLFAGALPQGVHVVPLVHLLGGLGGLVVAKAYCHIAANPVLCRRGSPYEVSPPSLAILCERNVQNEAQVPDHPGPGIRRALLRPFRSNGSTELVRGVGRLDGHQYRHADGRHRQSGSQPG